MSVAVNAPRYVLVTAAYNEDRHIERLIRAVVSQTIPPVRWVVVSDASSDRTDDIVREYSKRYEFIRLHRITEGHPRNFAAQVLAINTGVAQVKNLEYGFIGNLDADVSFAPGYFERVLAQFFNDARLGLAGGWICEDDGRQFQPRPRNTVRSVPHAVQLFRRECFEQLGAYVALPYGGPDWHAEIRCRMNGWRVESFPDIWVQHHRPTGSAGNWFHEAVRQGKMDHSFGSHPVFEVPKCIVRLPGRPLCLGALVRAFSFFWSYCSREPRQVPQEVRDFLRNEQLNRIRELVGLGPGPK